MLFWQQINFQPSLKASQVLVFLDTRSTEILTVFPEKTFCERVNGAFMKMLFFVEY